MRNDKKNLIVDKSFNFSLQIMDFVLELEQNRKFVFANQLFKSGTSIGANIREAQNAESKKDFIHKMKIAAKEADETYYWIELCAQALHYPTPNEKVRKEIIEINKILSKIIATSKK